MVARSRSCASTHTRPQLERHLASGTYTWASGDKYVGQYKDDKQHWEGTFTWADGEKYVGQFKDDYYHGLGKFTWADGEVDHDGEWENGQPKE